MLEMAHTSEKPATPAVETATIGGFRGLVVSGTGIRWR